ncbi:unnamed protein product [Arctogadus glacialis]
MGIMGLELCQHTGIATVNTHNRTSKLFVQFGNCVYLIFPFCLLLGVSSEVVWCRPPMVLCDGTGPLTTRTSAPGTSGGSRFTKFCLLFEPVAVLRMPPLPECALQVKADVRSVAAIAALVCMALFWPEGMGHTWVTLISF